MSIWTIYPLTDDRGNVMKEIIKWAGYTWTSILKQLSKDNESPKIPLIKWSYTETQQVTYDWIPMVKLKANIVDELTRAWHIEAQY